MKKEYKGHIFEKRLDGYYYKEGGYTLQWYIYSSENKVKLNKEDIVYHIDNDKDNNDILNLKLITKQEIDIILNSRMTYKKCLQCNNVYTTVSSKSIYCSNACKLKAFREQRKLFS